MGTIIIMKWFNHLKGGEGLGIEASDMNPKCGFTDILYILSNITGERK